MSRPRHEDLLAFYQGNGATASNLIDAELEFLKAQGVSANTTIDGWMEYLSSIAPPDVARSLPDLKYWFWDSDYAVIPI